jgi:hypothetical protein
MATGLDKSGLDHDYSPVNRPLLMLALFFVAAGAMAKIDSSLRLNHHRQI